MEQHRPKPGESDLRNFEWRYLYRLSHAELLTLKGYTNYVYSVAYSPDGKRLASAGGVTGGGGLKVWDAKTGKELLSLNGGGYSVAFSPDGNRLLAGAGIGLVKVRDAKTGQELLSLKGHSGDVTSVAFSPDGHRLATDSADGTVRIWDATPLPEKP